MSVFNEFMHVAEITVPLLMEGLGITAAVSALSIVIALILGMLLSYVCLFRMGPFEKIARIFIKIFRCTPFMVQVYIAYYGLPVIGIKVSAFWTGVIILGLYTSAYLAVILESGFNAVPRGQYESAFAAGMGRLQTMKRIIIPQALRIVIPALTGQLIQTVKDSSILSIITVAEMTMMTKEAIGITFSPLFVYVCAAVFYWALNLIIEFTSKRIEKRCNRAAL